jgi:hypothetical protein
VGKDATESGRHDIDKISVLLLRVCVTSVRESARSAREGVLSTKPGVPEPREPLATAPTLAKNGVTRAVYEGTPDGTEGMCSFDEGVLSQSM